jgi:hypothetical protein
MTADEPTVVGMAGHQSSTVDDLTRAIAKSIGDHEFEEAHGLVHSVTGKWRSPGSSAALNGLLRFRVRIEMTRTAVVRERFGLDGDSDRYADASLLLLSLLSGRLVAATTTDGSQRSDGVRTHALRAAALRVADELIRRGACRGDDRALGLAVRLELLPQAEAMLSDGCRPPHEDRHGWLRAWFADSSMVNALSKELLKRDDGLLSEAGWGTPGCRDGRPDWCARNRDH